jgi:hypothetical protein
MVPGEVVDDRGRYTSSSRKPVVESRTIHEQSDGRQLHEDANRTDAVEPKKSSHGIHGPDCADVQRAALMPSSDARLAAESPQAAAPIRA